MRRRQPSGLTMVELMVGVGLLGLVAVGYYRFQSQTYKMVRVVSDNAALALALTAIEKDISQDVPFLPPQDSDDPATNSTTFDSPTKAGLRCYDKAGGPMGGCDGFSSTPTIYFRVRFYKVRVLDETFAAASPLAKMPLSRVRFKVDYKVDNKVQEPMYFSRLFADALRQ